MRLVLFVLLTLAAIPAWAKWEKVGEDFIGVYYYDPASLTKKGGFVRVQIIQDVTKNKFSRKAVWEFDCKGHRFRVASASTLSGPMGSGKTQETDSEGTKWFSIPGNSPVENVYKKLCR